MNGHSVPFHTKFLNYYVMAADIALVDPKVQQDPEG